MKDEQQLHGASPELSLHRRIIVKSDLETRRGVAERKSQRFQTADEREYSQMREIAAFE